MVQVESQQAQQKHHSLLVPCSTAHQSRPCRMKSRSSCRNTLAGHRSILHLHRMDLRGDEDVFSSTIELGGGKV